MSIRVGTCSWADKSLVSAGTFYPAWAKTPEARLKFYASIFPVVEVDSTYYSLPDERTPVLWVKRTPDDFVFHVKMFRLFTMHYTEVQVLPPDLRPLAPQGKSRFYLRDASKELAAELLRRFSDVLLPLDSAGKLGVVLLQFPQWVTPRPDVYEHILAMQEALSQYTMAVEFRNRVWFEGERQDRLLQWLRDHKLVHVCVDEPQGFASSIPPVAAATANIAYVRFHGRNKETWEARGGTSAVRFNWYYQPEELEEWVPRVRTLQEQAKEVHVLFNTNNGDQGPHNAIRMGRLLKEGLADNGDAIRDTEVSLGIAH